MPAISKVTDSVREYRDSPDCPSFGHRNAISKLCAKECSRRQACWEAEDRKKTILGKSHTIRIICERDHELEVMKAVDRIDAYAKKQVAKIEGATIAFAEGDESDYYEER